MLAADALLERLAGALKERIGPEVGEPYAKTQAFMASVILQKVASHIRLADAHAAADREDQVALLADLDQLLASGAPSALQAAVSAVRSNTASLSLLVETLYATRDELGSERFDTLLARVRSSLRARLDRQLERST